MTTDELLAAGMLPNPEPAPETSRPASPDEYKAYVADLSDLVKPYLDAGLRVTLLKRSGNDLKCPLWKGYLDESVQNWTFDDFRTQATWAVSKGIELTGFGVVNGAKSGHRHVLDFDQGQFLPAIRQKVLDETGFDLNTLPRVRSGRTTSEGYHLILRSTASRKKQPLANYAKGESRWGVIVELCGAGSQTVAPGCKHRSGRRYVVEHGDPVNPPVIDLDLFDRILAVIRTFDEKPPTPVVERTSRPASRSRNDESVIDVFLSRNTIDDVLRQFGYTHTGGDFYRHPNNGDSEHSVHILGDVAHFFSPNDPMGGGTTANAFGVYCKLKYQGDLTACVRDLAHEYGMVRPRQPEDYSWDTPAPFEPVSVATDATTDTPTPQPRPKLNIRTTSRAAATIAEPPVVIDGLLRAGECMNIIATPKMRKSWAVGDLAICVANGLPWLGRFPCRKAKVLVIDNELREWQLQKRFNTMLDGKKIADPESVDYVALRDDGLLDLDQLTQAVDVGYSLIILDALYRLYPEDHDENSNADWTRLYNKLDAWARRTGAAVVIVHHAAKGDQSARSTTDSGAGGGAQSRAADAHVVLRAETLKGKPQDDAPDRATLTAVVRSFAPLERVHLEWKFPFWHTTMPVTPTCSETPTTTEVYAKNYAREVWESRATIEGRAKEAGQKVREAKEYFEGAVAEGFIEFDIKVEGKRRNKLYKLRTGTDERPF